MNELSNGKTMTVKEVAEVLGYKPDTIQGKVKELFPEIVKNGITTYLNQKQVLIIKQKLVPRTLGLKSEVESAITEIEIQQKITEGYRLAVELANRYKQRAELAEQKCIEQQPKVEFAEAVTGSTDVIDIGIAAKTLNLGIGRNKLFEILRRKGILQQSNIPYQKYVDSGYFRTIEQKYSTPDGTTHINIKTVVYQRGLDFIRKTIKENEAK
jgi:phage antirepressor YoqD-like protein